MATLPNPHRELWPRERAGYEDRRTAAYPAGDPHRVHTFLNWTAWEARVATMIVGGAAIWAAAIASSAGRLDLLWMTPGPRETAAIGMLIWLHAKWQRSVTLR